MEVYIPSSGGIGQASAYPNQLNGAQNAVRQSSMTERLYRDLCQLRELIFDNTNRLQNMAERTLGPAPQPPESSSTPKPMGTMGEIAQQLDLLRIAGQRQNDLIVQLENIL